MESRDEWGQPRDDDPGGEYPSAPIPPHERAWRHPSELAASTIRELPPAGPLGRGLAVATGVAAVVLAVGLVRLLAPGGTSVASIGATSVPLLRTTTTSATSATPTTTALRGSSTSDAPISTAPATTGVANGPPSTLVTALGSSAIAWSDGTSDARWAVTSAEGLVPGATTDVAMPDGSSRTAEVVAVDDASGLAVLALTTADPDSDDAGVLPPPPAVGDLPGPGASVLAIARDGTAVAATLVETDDGMAVEPATAVEIPHGSPITDESGSVVGLCGRSVDGRAIVLDLGSVAGLVRSTTGGWIGIIGTLDGRTVTVTEVVEGSPAFEAGLVAGDVIVQVGGIPVEDLADFSEAIRQHDPGTELVISVQRPRAIVDIVVTIGDRAEHVAASSPPPATTAPGAAAAPTTVATATTATGTSPGGSPAPTSPTTLPRQDPSRSTTAPASASG